MAQNNMLGLALIAGGGYLLYKMGLLDSIIDTVSGNGAATPIGNATQQTNGSAVVSFDLRTAMAARARSMSLPEMLNWDQWNFIYSEVRGAAGPPIEAAPDIAARGREFQLTIDEYLDAAKPLGVGSMIISTKIPSSYVEQGRGRLYDWNGSPMYSNSPFNV